MSSMRGFTLLEVLVAMFIVAIGILGAVGLQAYAHRTEFEAYQRAQALILVRDMVDRIQANRSLIDCFALTVAPTGTPFVGTAGSGSLAGATLPCSAVIAGYAEAQQALTQWDAALKGAGEVLGGTNVGTMVGARGCISATADPATGMLVYTVAVAWQGDAPLFVITDPQDPPRPAVACGQGLYGNEAQRRVVWVTFRVANLKA
jgi:type IV pilus assembly protein PilV